MLGVHGVTEDEAVAFDMSIPYMSLSHGYSACNLASCGGVWQGSRPRAKYSGRCHHVGDQLSVPVS